MVLEQTEGVGISDGVDVLCIKFHEVNVIAVFNEDGLAVVTALEDVVCRAGAQRS